MIVQLRGTLIEISSAHCVLDVGGVCYELGISTSTASALPALNSSGVSLFTRLVVREDAQELYGFSTREERALFDRLRAISGVGPKLALATLSTFSPAQLASVVSAQNVDKMASVPGVGKKKAGMLLVALEDVFAKDSELKSLVGLSDEGIIPGQTTTSEQEANAALLSMGFSPQEAELALEGADEQTRISTEQLLAYALRRLGGKRA